MQKLLYNTQVATTTIFTKATLSSGCWNVFSSRELRTTVLIGYIANVHIKLAIVASVGGDHDYLVNDPNNYDQQRYSSNKKEVGRQ